MKYQLFISGTPGDYESFPKGDEHASEYCKQFFNLPATATFHSADYYVELFPMEKMAYYTLMHRKNVSSTRENAYLALTLKFSGGYVEDIKTVFSILETLYNNYVIGNVTEIVGNGEKYKLSSLAAFESLRAKAETELGATLNLLGKSVKEFDSSFSSKRQQASKQLWYLDESNKLLAREMKATHRLRLIPTSDGFEEVVNQANGQIAALNAQVSSLTAINNEVNWKLSSANQIIKEKDEAYNKLMKSFRELEDQLKKMPKPTPDDVFKNKVLGKLDNIESSISNIQPIHIRQSTSGQNNRGTTLEEKEVPDWKKWLLWGLLAIGVVIIAILGLRIFNSENSENGLREALSEQKKKYDELSSSYDKLKAEKNAIQAEYNSFRQIYGTMSNGVDTPQEEFGIIPFSIGGKDDTKFYVWNSYKLTYKTKPRDFDHWEVFQGKENGVINQDRLSCRKEGSITLGGADKNGNPLEGFVRTIKIERQYSY